MKDLFIRNETRKDYFAVEQMTREAFWNLYVPGGDEHYLVHVMREHEDFIPELALVAELNDQIIGNVMYTKAKLIDESLTEKSILTFGPLSVHPDFQRQGIGKKLLEHSFTRAVEMGFDTIVIFGNPTNYVSRGFKSCIKYNICLENDVFPTAMLVKELKEHVLDGRKWRYQDSDVYHFEDAKAEVEEYDKLFEAKEKKYQITQEEFYIHSHSVIQEISFGE